MFRGVFFALRLSARSNSCRTTYTLACKRNSPNGCFTHIATREENILVNDFHGGIQSLLKERSGPSTHLALDQCNFGDTDYTPMTPAELQVASTQRTPEGIVSVIESTSRHRLESFQV